MKDNLPNDEINLENFDDFFVGEPADIEVKLTSLLPKAKELENKSIYLQILSKIALSQAMQQKFDLAQKTLDLAEANLTPEYELARARITIERGRFYHQMGNLSAALKLYEEAYQLSLKNNFDYHAIDAAHMIAIILEIPEEKIKWNTLALQLAEKTGDQQAQFWLGSLYNNLGQNYLEAEQYEKALQVFEKSLEYRKKENSQPNIRFAKWAIGRTLRFLGRLDEALEIQSELLTYYNTLSESGELGIPVEMFKLVRGFIYEELAELYHAKTRLFASSAYKDLSDNAGFKAEVKRLERLKELQK